MIHRVLVIGATGSIGRFLLPQLLAAGMEVHGVTRAAATPAGADPRIVWHHGDVSGKAFMSGEFDAIIYIAFLDMLPHFLRENTIGGMKHIIAFGSTSRFTKAFSPDAHENTTAARLAQGEKDLASWCDERKIGWTILRPTLIYGGVRDGNISLISRIIRRFHVFPLIGRGHALRQPVHAEDLANAVFLALGNAAVQGKAYNVSGGETLTYRAMVARIFEAMGKKPRFITLPLPVLRMLANAVRLLPGYRHVTLEMATRLQEDLCFSHDEATHDFGYAPGPFRPQIS